MAGCEVFGRYDAPAANPCRPHESTAAMDLPAHQLTMTALMTPDTADAADA